MATVKTLRKQARELGIAGRSTMRKAELLSAIHAARARLEATPASDSLTQPAVPTPVPVEAPAEKAVRKHRHSGALPLLPPLSLRSLPHSYDMTHLAVLPRNPHQVVVFWAIRPQRLPAGGATLELWSDDEIVGTAAVDHVLGRYYFGDLQDDRALSARILKDGEVIATSGTVLLPPAGPSRLHQPVMAAIPADKPLATLPRDLRRAAQPAPLPADATASELAWAAATDGSAATGVVRETDEPAHFSPAHHEQLVSSFEHAVRSLEAK